MHLVPENINEAIKYLPGRSTKEIEEKLVGLSLKEYFDVYGDMWNQNLDLFIKYFPLIFQIHSYLWNTYFPGMSYNKVLEHIQFRIFKGNTQIIDFRQKDEDENLVTMVTGQKLYNVNTMDEFLSIYKKIKK